MNDLVLRSDVVEAVARGEFHIYAIQTIEEGIETLTGVAAGRRRKDGTYRPGGVFALVDRRLDEIAQELKRFSEG